MKTGIKNSVALLLAFSMVFSVLAFNAGAARPGDIIEWPVFNYSTGEVDEYEALNVGGTVSPGKTDIKNDEQLCYAITVPETGYYLFSFNKDFDYSFSVSMNGNKVENYISPAINLRSEDGEEFNTFLWLEKDCTCYTRFSSSAPNKNYTVGLTFLGEIVSAEIEKDELHVDREIIYDDFYTVFDGTPYKVFIDSSIVFSSGFTDTFYVWNACIDSLEPGRHTMRINLFNGHGPDFEVTVVDDMELIDHFEILDKELSLYARVDENGVVQYSVSPDMLMVYFKDGSSAPAPKKYGPYVNRNGYVFTQPDGTEKEIMAEYQVSADWNHKTLEETLDDVINKTFDRYYVNPDGKDDVYFVGYLENRETPVFTEKAFLDRYGPSRYNPIGTVISFAALPVMLLLRAVCNIIPFFLQDGLAHSVTGFYHKYML